MHNDSLDISVIFKDVLLTSSQLELLTSKLKRVSVTKGTILIYPGELVKYQYYVVEGCLRTYFVDRQNKEHTVQFAIEDWWISDYTAFIYSADALLSIECLKDATLLRMSREDMNELLKQIPPLETFFRKKLERAFASFQIRILGSLSQSAKERYIGFMNSYPFIEKNVKNYHIASYLGITTESLSRIRREIAND